MIFNSIAFILFLIKATRTNTDKEKRQRFFYSRGDVPYEYTYEVEIPARGDNPFNFYIDYVPGVGRDYLQDYKPQEPVDGPLETTDQVINADDQLDTKDHKDSVNGQSVTQEHKENVAHQIHTEGQNHNVDESHNNQLTQNSDGKTTTTQDSGQLATTQDNGQLATTQDNGHSHNNGDSHNDYNSHSEPYLGHFNDGFSTFGGNPRGDADFTTQDAEWFKYPRGDIDVNEFKNYFMQGDDPNAYNTLNNYPNDGNSIVAKVQNPKEGDVQNNVSKKIEDKYTVDKALDKNNSNEIFPEQQNDNPEDIRGSPRLFDRVAGDKSQGDDQLRKRLITGNYNPLERLILGKRLTFTCSRSNPSIKMYSV